MEDRVVDIDLRGSFDMKIVRGLTSAETEHVLCEVTATDAPGYRTKNLARTAGKLLIRNPCAIRRSCASSVNTFTPSPVCWRTWVSLMIRRWGPSRRASRAQFPKVCGMGQAPS